MEDSASESDGESEIIDFSSPLLQLKDGTSNLKSVVVRWDKIKTYMETFRYFTSNCVVKGMNVAEYYCDQRVPPVTRNKIIPLFELCNQESYEPDRDFQEQLANYVKDQGFRVEALSSFHSEQSNIIYTSLVQYLYDNFEMICIASANNWCTLLCVKGHPHCHSAYVDYLNSDGSFHGFKISDPSDAQQIVQAAQRYFIEFCDNRHH